MFFDYVQAIGLGIVAMNDEGQLRLPRERHLITEDAVLHFARGMIVEIIKADFAPGDNFGMLRQASQFI